MILWFFYKRRLFAFVVIILNFRARERFIVQHSIFPWTLFNARIMILPRISVKIHSLTRIYRAPSQIAGRNRKKITWSARIFQYLPRHPQYISFKN